MRIAVLTSDTHSWLLRGFYRQWLKYGVSHDLLLEEDPFELEVVGFTKPADLPEQLPFYSVGSFTNYPVNRWSDALIDYLETCQEDLITILLEDYWLLRAMNRQAVLDAYSYMIKHPEAIRFDLAADRMFSRQAEYVEPFASLDICEAKGDYSLSFQASIFRRKLLLELLRPSETPWQTELSGSTRLNSTSYRVFGSYQWPINYLIVMNKGRIDATGQWMYPARTLLPEDWRDLIAHSCLVPGGKDEYALQSSR